MRLLLLLGVSKMSKVNCFLCHRIVSHIINCEISFDTADLEEFGVEKILADYGWHPVLNEAEKEVICSDLYDLALRHEMAEVTRSMHPDEFLAIHGPIDASQVCPEADMTPIACEPILAH